MIYAAAEVIIFIISYWVIYVKWVVPNNAWKPAVSCFLCTVLSVYLVGIIHFTLFYRDIANSMSYELALFWSYKVVWEEFSINMWWEIVNNILLFIPMGVLVPLMFQKLRSIWKTILAAFACSAVIELCQLVFKIGLFEFDDMFNNTLGACVGYGVFRVGYLAWQRPKNRKLEIIGWLVAIIIGAAYFCIMRSKF